MVRVGFDLLIIGGLSNKDIIKLSCSNKSCNWQTLSIKWEDPRWDFVGVTVPDDFLDFNC